MSIETDRVERTTSRNNDPHKRKVRSSLMGTQVKERKTYPAAGSMQEFDIEVMRLSSPQIPWVLVEISIN